MVQSPFPARNKGRFLSGMLHPVRKPESDMGLFCLLIDDDRPFHEVEEAKRGNEGPRLLFLAGRLSKETRFYEASLHLCSFFSERKF